MIMCAKCYNSITDMSCRCHPNNGYFEVDDSIFDIIRILNQNGYYTEYCCGGHVSINVYDYPEIYIKFTKKTFDSITEFPEYFNKEKLRCVIRYTVPVKSFIIYKSNIPKYKQYIQELYDKDVMQKVDRDLQDKRKILMLWAVNLPSLL